MSWLDKFLRKFGYLSANYVSENYVHRVLYEDSHEDFMKYHNKSNKQAQEIKNLREQIKTSTILYTDVMHACEILEAEKSNISKELIAIKLRCKKHIRNEDRLLKERRKLKEEIKELNHKLNLTQPQYNLVKNELIKYKSKTYKQENTINMLVQYQERLNWLIDIYRYGYSPSYLESLKPRTLVEIPVNEIRRKYTL